MTACRRAWPALAAAAGAVLLSGAASAAQADAVTFRDAWYRTPLPGVVVTAAYCRLENRGDSKATLVRFEALADDDLRVELHETQTVAEDGMEMVRMRPVREIDVLPGTTATLAPGGRHLMVFNAAGTGSLTLRAIFADGSATGVLFERRPAGDP